MEGENIKYIEYTDFLFVFWVKTGQEEKAVKEINAVFKDEITFLKLMVETFFRKKGEVKKVTHLAFPGYLFVITEIKNDEFVMRAQECVRKSKATIRLLCYGDTHEAAICQEERAALDYLWQGKDCIETSKGFIKGERVFITDGPLVGRESVIKEIRPRRRQAIVEIEIMGGVRRATVGLEILERLP